jgi:hypothetical protein
MLRDYLLSSSSQILFSSTFYGENAANYFKIFHQYWIEVQDIFIIILPCNFKQNL